MDDRYDPERIQSLPEDSLTRVLLALGLTHQQNKKFPTRHDILRGEEVVFSGNAYATWDWLRETNQYPSPTSEN